ncbi:MAG: hypothetical protein JWL62_2568 [Hyphomicrobiales bacterium]|nr:hypothetical protein [Hyphomicrobiales bacterium]
MRLISLNVVFIAGLASVPSLALAAGAEPIVLRGVYADDGRQRVASAPNLGGGFIEMLVRGTSDPMRGTRYNQPEAMPMAPAAPRYVPAQQASFAPPPVAVRRTIDPMFARQEVTYTGSQKAGAIVVDTPSKFLYLVLGNGRAMRYGIGVGRPGFEWAGVKTITRKAEWPDWRPPSDMLKRRPDLPKFMAGGPENPLGARALYLGSTMYRIHGTNEPHTIGQNVSSGCIRMMNEDVTDLYTRVKVGTQVTVI